MGAQECAQAYSRTVIDHVIDSLNTSYGGEDATGQEAVAAEREQLMAALEHAFVAGWRAARGGPS